MKKFGFWLLKHNIHIMTAIFLFQLQGVSPGWYTAVLMAAYSIWAIVVINRDIDYDGIQWLWGALMFLGCFLCLEVLFQKLIENTLSNIKQSVVRFRKERFGQ